jgi:hypothetical protein
LLSEKGDIIENDEEKFKVNGMLTMSLTKASFKNNEMLQGRGF